MSDEPGGGGAGLSFLLFLLAMPFLLFLTAFLIPASAIMGKVVETNLIGDLLEGRAGLFLWVYIGGTIALAAAIFAAIASA